MFFLDPGYRNFSFLGNLNFNKKFGISNYKTLKNIVEKIFIKGQMIKINNSYSFCLNSNKVSVSILKNLSIY